MLKHSTQVMSDGGQNMCVELNISNPAIWSLIHLDLPIYIYSSMLKDCDAEDQASMYIFATCHSCLKLNCFVIKFNSFALV